MASLPRANMAAEQQAEFAEMIRPTLEQEYHRNRVRNVENARRALDRHAQDAADRASRWTTPERLGPQRIWRGFYEPSDALRFEVSFTSAPRLVWSVAARGLEVQLNIFGVDEVGSYLEQSFRSAYDRLVQAYMMSRSGPPSDFSVRVGPCSCASCMAAARTGTPQAQRYFGVDWGRTEYTWTRGGFESERDRERAEGRARELLLQWLSAEQKAQLQEKRSFDVRGGATGKWYRIHEGTSQNVFLLDRYGRPVEGLCFVPVGSLCAGDVMLAQKVALESDEQAALKVAQPFASSRLQNGLREAINNAIRSHEFDLRPGVINWLINA